MNNILFSVMAYYINAKDKLIFREVTPVKIDAPKPKDKDCGRGRTRENSRHRRGDKGNIIQVHSIHNKYLLTIFIINFKYCSTYINILVYWYMVRRNICNTYC